MHQKLKWNAIGLEQKTKLLLEKIVEDKNNEPEGNLRNVRKFEGYIEELNHILQNIEIIKTSIIPKLEKLFHLEFRTPELLMIALSRPSIRNIYEQMHIHF